jgi:hypothetical protein
MGLLRRPTPGGIVEGGRLGRPCGPGAPSRAISENPTCGCAAIPHFHMTLSPHDQFGQQRRFWCYHPDGTGLARPGLPWSKRAQRLRVRWRPHWRRLAVVAAPRRGADGIDRTIRSTKSCLTTLFAGFRLLGCPGTSPPLDPPSPGGKEVPCPTSGDPPATAGLDRDRRPRDPAGRAAGHGPPRPGPPRHGRRLHLSMIFHPQR